MAKKTKKSTPAPNQVQQPARPIRRGGNPFQLYLFSLIRQGRLPKEDIDKFYDGAMTQEDLINIHEKYSREG